MSVRTPFFAEIRPVFHGEQFNIFRDFCYFWPGLPICQRRNSKVTLLIGFWPLKIGSDPVVVETV
jgi:hypothetical protein